MQILKGPMLCESKITSLKGIYVYILKENCFFNVG